MFMHIKDISSNSVPQLRPSWPHLTQYIDQLHQRNLSGITFQEDLNTQIHLWRVCLYWWCCLRVLQLQPRGSQQLSGCAVGGVLVIGVVEQSTCLPSPPSVLATLLSTSAAWLGGGQHTPLQFHWDFGGFIRSVQCSKRYQRCTSPFILKKQSVTSPQ